MAEQAAYTHGHHESVVKVHARRTAENSAAFLLPHIQTHHQILDIGCGPGSISIGLAKRVPQGRVVGCDTSADVLEQAKTLAASQNVTNITFQTLDANALPFADDFFDITYAHQVLQHVADPLAILKEMRRVTKSGGFVAARDVDLRSFAFYPEDHGLDDWQALYLRIAKSNGAQPNAGRYLPAWAAQAGFRRRDVQFTWGHWNYQGADGVAYGRSWVDRVLHSSFASTAKAHGLASQSELEAISLAWESWADGPEEDRFIIIPNGEILCRVA